MICTAPGTVRVISRMGMPPARMASTASSASAADVARTTGTMPISRMRCMTLIGSLPRLLGYWAGLLGYWVAGLLGCWVAGLLGYWVTGLLGCWVAVLCSVPATQKNSFVRKKSVRSM